MENQPQAVAIDPANPPPGMFLILVVEKLNEKGEIETTVQGKIDEPYAVECCQRGVEVLKIHQANINKLKNTSDMKIEGA
jgi:hypothetical protein